MPEKGIVIFPPSKLRGVFASSCELTEEHIAYIISLKEGDVCESHAVYRQVDFYFYSENVLLKKMK